MRYGDLETFAIRELDETLLGEVALLEERNLPNPWSREMIKAEFQKDFSRRLGVFSQDRLLAYLLAHLVGNEFHILTLCVDYPFRRKGLGRLLLETALHRACVEGGVRAWLEVRAGNIAARRLYAVVGFEERFIRKGYYSDNREDAVVLEAENLSKLDYSYRI